MAANSDFRSERFLAMFNQQVASILPTKFQVNWPFGSGEADQDFQDSSHLDVSDLNNFSFSYLQVTPILPTKFQVAWLFGSGEAAQNRFSK